MTTKLVALVLLCLMTGTAMAQEPKITSPMSKDLPERTSTDQLNTEIGRLGVEGTSPPWHNPYTN